MTDASDESRSMRFELGTDGPSLILVGLAEQATNRQIAADLKHQVEVGAAAYGLDAVFYLAAGDPVTEITRLAEQLHADAVVVGASESAGHRLIGSIASRLVRSGRWPVTVVP
jgi:nucleotide-binding universal stress UspA family protein